VASRGPSMSRSSWTANGRWATRRGLRASRAPEGVKAARTIVRAADALGLRYLTLSLLVENWSRPEGEVSTLCSCSNGDRSELPELMRATCVSACSAPHGVPGPGAAGIDHVVQATRDNAGLTLMMAFTTAGVRRAHRRLRALAGRSRRGSSSARRSGRRRSSVPCTRRRAGPRLLIRTSGEMRVSNFLLWQIATRSCGSRDPLPDFAVRRPLPRDREFQRRTRRFGGWNGGGHETDHVARRDRLHRSSDTRSSLELLEEFEVAGLAARGSNVERIADLCRKYSPARRRFSTPGRSISLARLLPARAGAPQRAGRPRRPGARRRRRRRRLGARRRRRAPATMAAILGDGPSRSPTRNARDGGDPDDGRPRERGGVRLLPATRAQRGLSVPGGHTAPTSTGSC